MAADADADDEVLLAAVLDAFQALAARLGDAARLRSVQEHVPADEHFGARTEVTWCLEPTRAGAAPVRWWATGSDAHSVHLDLGASTSVEVLTSPAEPVAANVDRVMDLVEAAVRGDFREESWHTRDTGERVGGTGRYRSAADGRWHACGTFPPPPIVRDLLWDLRVTTYAPYGDAGASRVGL